MYQEISKRAGVGEKPVRVRCIEDHFRAAVRTSNLVGTDGFLPLKRTHIMVCCNRWYTIALRFRLLQVGAFFIQKNRYTIQHTIF